MEPILNPDTSLAGGSVAGQTTGFKGRPTPFIRLPHIDEEGDILV